MLCCAGKARRIMQTNFTAEQLRDPQIAEANGILQTCVHYGFCTNTCPTYVLTRDENESPRGRIDLIRAMLEKGGAPDPNPVAHLDSCLSALSCMPPCAVGGLFRSVRPRASLYPGAFQAPADRACAACVSRARAAASTRVRRVYVARTADASVETA